MSSNSREIPQTDVEKVAEMAAEPSYISEIARKLMAVDEDWQDLNELTAVARVAKIAALLSENMGIDEVTMPPDAGGQAESSRKLSLSPVDSEERVDDESGMFISETWQDYKIIWNTNINFDEIRDDYLDVIDGNTTVEDKLEVARTLSERGNQMSKDAETIMQDVMERQFRFYDVTESTDYNDSAPDFLVVDGDRRDWGLMIEVSVRWVNPIDKPYIQSKKEEAFENDYDLLILAPRFTDRVIEKYENPKEPNWHADPLSEMVHIHNIPSMDANVFKPFAKEPEDIQPGELDTEGNPVIIPDGEDMRQQIEQFGQVGDEYPVVDEPGEFPDLLDDVFREYRLITESMYRNQLREAMEPLLWEFLRPYKIEQFLIDMYWDKELTQSEIGGLVDRSGSTIGTWMRDWGVMRRGTGAPELGDEIIEIWSRMYRGEDPFQEQFSGYRIQAEYNRHPMWTLEDWRQWYNDTTQEERQEILARQDSFRNNLGYTILTGASERLLPSYTFILGVLDDNGVEIRQPDEAPRVPYNAYPSRQALEYQINRNQDTIVDVSEE